MNGEPKFGGETMPRDITRYEPTSHFMQRLKYRTDPSPSKQIATDTVEEGVIKNTQDSHRLIFEHEADGHTWRVLVQVNEDAFDRGSAHHWLLTIYALGVHDGAHGEVFDADEVGA